MSAERSVGWRNVLSVVRASAERRLGKTLVITYAVLLLIGALVVASSVAFMYWRT